MNPLHKTLIALFAALMLAACGGGSSSSSDKKPTPTPSCEQTNSCEPEPSCEETNSCEPEPGCEETNSCEPVKHTVSTSVTEGRSAYTFFSKTTVWTGASFGLIPYSENGSPYMLQILGIPDNKIRFRITQVVAGDGTFLNDYGMFTPAVENVTVSLSNLGDPKGVSITSDRKLLITTQVADSYQAQMYTFQSANLAPASALDLPAPDTGKWDEIKPFSVDNNGYAFYGFQQKNGDNHHGQLMYIGQNSAPGPIFDLGDSVAGSFVQAQDYAYAVLHSSQLPSRLVIYNVGGDHSLTEMTSFYPANLGLGDNANSSARLNDIWLRDNHLYLSTWVDLGQCHPASGNENASWRVYAADLASDGSVDLDTLRLVSNQPIGDSHCEDMETALTTDEQWLISTRSMEDEGSDPYHYINHWRLTQASGTISPASAQVNAGETTELTINANNGTKLTSIAGCGVALNSSTMKYQTGAITANCTVTAAFDFIDWPENEGLLSPVDTYTLTTKTTGQQRYSQASQTDLSVGAIFPFSKGDLHFAYLLEPGAAPDTMDLMLYQLVNNELERVVPAVSIPAFNSEQTPLGFAISPDANQAVMPVMVNDGSFRRIHYDIKDDGNLVQTRSQISGYPYPAYTEVSIAFTRDSSRLYLAARDDNGSSSVAWYNKTGEDTYDWEDSWSPPANTIINSLGFTNDGSKVFVTQHGDVPGLYQYSVGADGSFSNPTEIDVSSLTAGGWLDQISILDNQLHLPIIKNAHCDDNGVPNGNNSDASYVLYRMDIDATTGALNTDHATTMFDWPFPDEICSLEDSQASNNNRYHYLFSPEVLGGAVMALELKTASGHISGNRVIAQSEAASLTISPDTGVTVDSVSSTCGDQSVIESGNHYTFSPSTSDCEVSVSFQFQN